MCQEFQVIFCLASLFCPLGGILASNFQSVRAVWLVEHFEAVYLNYLMLSVLQAVFKVYELGAGLITLGAVSYDIFIVSYF